MIRIAPSILSADFSALADAIDGIADDADWLHVDVMDGHFVPNLTIGPPVVKSLRGHTPMYLDCHLMITNPEKYLEAFKTAGASGCSVHVELGGTKELIAQMRDLGLDAGLAVNPDTPLSAYEEFLGDIDLVLLMTVFPGFGGQKFMEEVVPKIRDTAAVVKSSGFDVVIEVDGGIDERTAPVVAEAGATVFVAGNAVFGTDEPAAAIRRIRDAGTSALSASDKI